MKKLFALLLSSLLLFEFAVPVAAFKGERSVVMASYVSSINKDGSNIGTDITHPENILEPKRYDVVYSINDQRIDLTGTVNGVAFSVTGCFATVNENRNVLLYKAADTLKNMDVAYLGCERALDETSLFFAGFQKGNPEYHNAIKLYMQPLNTNSLVLIEIFLTEDHVLSFLDSHSIKRDAYLSDTLQSWFVRYYEPISRLELDDPSPKNHVGYTQKNHSKSYNISGAEVTFKFIIHLYYDVPDLSRGGDAEAELYVYIYESKTVSSLPANNSSTQSYLRLEDINVKFSMMPYLYCTSQSPYRYKTQNSSGSFSTGFSVFFGFSIGVLSAGGSFNFSPNEPKEMSTSSVPLPHSGSSFTKGTESGCLSSSRYLNRKGGYYGFKVHYMDGSGTERSGSLTVRFEYYIYNLYSYAQSESKTFTFYVPINVW